MEENHEVPQDITAEEWLRRWDAGEKVWSIALFTDAGGDAIGQELAAEMLRYMLANRPDPAILADGSGPAFHEYASKMVERTMGMPYEIISLAGGAPLAKTAVVLSVHLYRDTPMGVMRDPEVLDRHVVVQKSVCGKEVEEPEEART